MESAESSTNPVIPCAKGQRVPLYNMRMSIKDLASEAPREYRTIQATIAEALRKGILNGMLEGGEPLRQEEIAREFGVSRIPVREALKQLEGEGLITFSPYRGATVSKLSVEEVIETGEIKGALEPLALQLAIPKQTADDLQRAEELLEEAESEQIGARYAELSRRFHSALYAPAGRPRLLGMLQSVDITFDRYIRIYLEVMNIRDQAQQEHREILQFCKQRDSDAAVYALQQHIAVTVDRLLSYLGKESR